MNQSIDIILIIKDKSQSNYVESLLDPNIFVVTKFFREDTAYKYLKNKQELNKVVIFSHKLQQGNGFDLLKKLKDEKKEYSFVFLCFDNNVKLIFEAIQIGAINFLTTTYEIEKKLVPVIKKVYENQIENIEQKKLKQKYTRNNIELAKLSVVAKETSNSVLIFNINLELEWVNNAFEYLYGFTKDEFVKKYGKTLIDQSNKDNINAIVQDCIIKKQAISYTSKKQTKYGEQIWLQANISPVLNDENNIEKFVLIETDITEIKKAERKIIHQQRKISGINYAKKIQDAIFPKKEIIRYYFDDFFIYHKPKEIVSGDFPWFYVTDKYVYVAAIDCTGHGVPGAFLSFIGHSNLVNIIEAGFENTDEILFLLNRKINKLFKKENGKRSVDGMDMALCKIDFNEKIMQFSGAGRPLLMTKGNELIKYKGTFYGIGGYQLDYIKPNFEAIKINFESGNRFFIFSDGIPDQFKAGNPVIKYSRKRLNNCIKNNIDISMNDMYEKFVQDITEWRGHSAQTDDMLLMGFEFR